MLWLLNNTLNFIYLFPFVIALQSKSLLNNDILRCVNIPRVSASSWHTGQHIPKWEARLDRSSENRTVEKSSPASYKLSSVFLFPCVTNLILTVFFFFLTIAAYFQFHGRKSKDSSVFTWEWYGSTWDQHSDGCRSVRFLGEDESRVIKKTSGWEDPDENYLLLVKDPLNFPRNIHKALRRNVCWFNRTKPRKAVSLQQLHKLCFIHLWILYYLLIHI